MKNKQLSAGLAIAWRACTGPASNIELSIVTAIVLGSLGVTAYLLLRGVFGS